MHQDVFMSGKVLGGDTPILFGEGSGGVMRGRPAITFNRVRTAMGPIPEGLVKDDYIV